MADFSGLTIYKASAGSGKTFRLVGEYLKMLFARHKSYRNILAVTFTNKATAEMKERILKELAILSHGGESRYATLLRDYGNEQKIREKATSILKLILHDYSRFSVMTIDSFFQKVIRSFAREIRINASFRTEIDSRQALEQAIDLLFQEIEDNSLLMGWMIQFLEDNLEEGRSWDFRQELMKFGKEVEKEAFKVHGDEFVDTLAGKEKLGLYVAEMKLVLTESELLLKKMGEEGIRMISASGLQYDQLKGGRNSFANLFVKLAAGKIDSPTATMVEACDHSENWYKKSDSATTRELIEDLYHSGLNQFLKQTIATLETEQVKINSANAVLKNIYPFGLLGNIALKIKEVLKENDTVLLSDSGTMIGKVIEGNDTPFIYEKIGMIYNHFMLDEFQDTSRQQWANFRPLVENAIGSGFSSLVVGDVKQSIYRWRNGDWNLLANQLQADLLHQEIAIHPLDINWRSKKNIVDFNNALFRHASEQLNDLFEAECIEPQFSDLHGVIAEAYRDQYQKYSQINQSEGFVSITFVDPDASKSKNDFRESSLKLLVEQLESVQKAGVKAEEMTILVRENSEAEKIARALWERKKSDPQPGCIYDVITSDTLKVGQSQVVRFVVNFMQFFTSKETKQIRAEILYGYYRILLPMKSSTVEEISVDLHTLFDSSLPLPDLFTGWLEVDASPDFLAALLALPLFELVVAIADHFGLGEITGEKVYLQVFLDMVLEFGREDCGGIPGFLTWWEESGSNKTLNLPNIRNFIRISSIHQSKGLEYPTVFIPFCNWETGINSHKSPNVWSVPDSEPFNHLKMLLLKCDNKLKNSLFSRDYYKELLYSRMDNLNLLYVAMTRAVNNLFVIMPYKEEIKSVGNVAELMQTILSQPRLEDSIDQEKYISLGKYWNPIDRIFEMGRLDISEKQMQPVRKDRSNDPLILLSNDKRIEIRLHSKDYFQLTGNQQAERINKGTLMHQIFEKIRTSKDVGPAVGQMVSAGILTIVEGAEIQTRIEGLLAVNPYSDWFDDRWKVLNERDILRVGESKHRPDRVMLKENNAVVIDYKTGEKSDKDLRQMKGYLTDLKKMGFHTCEGNIWYLQINEVVKVVLD